MKKGPKINGVRRGVQVVGSAAEMVRRAQERKERERKEKDAKREDKKRHEAAFAEGDPREMFDRLMQADPSAALMTLSDPNLPQIRPIAKGKCATKFHPKLLHDRERQLRALQLRMAGYYFEEIAEHLGYATRSAACNAVKKILNATLSEAADDMRQMECMKIDTMVKTLWVRVLQGSLQDVDRVVKLLERKAKLMGLDMPSKSEISGLPPIVRVENAAKSSMPPLPPRKSKMPASINHPHHDPAIRERHDALPPLAPAKKKD